MINLLKRNWELLAGLIFFSVAVLIMNPGLSILRVAGSAAVLFAAVMFVIAYWER